MNALDLLDSIEKTSSRKEKEELLAAADECTKALLQWALDPYRTYGLQNIPAPPMPADLVPLNKEMEDMVLPGRVEELGWLLEELKSRRLVGNEARDMVGTFLREQPFNMAKWFHRVILKDLSCGITEKTVNKVFPGLIPSFSVQLAEDTGGIAPNKYPVWCDYKLDGIRVVAVKIGTTATLYSRKGHVIETLPTIKYLLEQVPDDFVLDGEVMGRSWNESQSTVFATVNAVDDSQMFYNVFDAMPVDCWLQQRCEYPYRVRRDLARHIIEVVSDTRIRLVGGKVVNSQEALIDFYKQAIQAGHEGIMIKDHEATYTFKRSKAVMKMKPSSTWEGTIVGWERGDPNGKWRDCFGAFQVQFKKGGPITSVGGGFTDEQRLEFTGMLTINPSHYNGQIVEVKGQELTKDGVVRFPVFVRFRDARDK